MALYQYTNTTEQLGVGHANKMVALKIDPTGDPVVTVLAETTASAGGAFTLEWGSDASPATEDWTGRVVIGALDNDDTVKLDCKFHDWLAGVIVVAASFGMMRVEVFLESLSAGHLWELNEASGSTWYDSIGSEDITITGTPVFSQDTPDQDSTGTDIDASAYGAATIDASGIYIVTAMIKTTNTSTSAVAWTTGNAHSKAICLWHNAGSDELGINTANSDIFGISGANSLMADGKWHCLISQIDPSDLTAGGSKMWLDGVGLALTQVRGTTPSSQTTTDDFVLGRYGMGGDNFIGTLARVSIISGVSLSDEQAKQLTTACFTGYVDGRVPISGLLSSYSFDARDGGASTDLYDDSNGAVATLANVTFQDGRIEEGAVFNGSSSQVSIADRTIPNDNFSVGFWFTKDANAASPREVIFCTGTDGETEAANANRLSILATTNEFEYFTETGAGDNHNYNLGHNAIVDGSRNYYLLTVDSGSLSLYENDVLVAGPTAVTVSTGTDQLFYLGRNMTVGSESWLDAVIDQFRVYDRVLSGAEITNLYDEGRAIGSYSVSTDVIASSDISTLSGDNNSVQPWGKPNQRRTWYNSYQSRWDGVSRFLSGTSDGKIVKNIGGTDTQGPLHALRNTGREDTIWDSTNKKLWVMESHQTSILIYLFDYAEGGDTYTINGSVNGVTITGLDVDNDDRPASFAQDADGHIWATVLTVAGLQVQRSQDDGQTWLASPVTLTNPASDGVAVAVPFSNGGTDYMFIFGSENGEGGHYAYYIDITTSDVNVASAGNWTDDTSNIPTLASGGSDDHLSGIVYNDTVYIVAKLENVTASDPEVVLFKRTSAGVWELFGVILQGGDERTRPGVSIDNIRDHLIVTWNNFTAGTAHYKFSSLTALEDLIGATEEVLIDVAADEFFNVCGPRYPDSELMFVAAEGTEEEVQYAQLTYVAP